MIHNLFLYMRAYGVSPLWLIPIVAVIACVVYYELTCWHDRVKMRRVLRDIAAKSERGEP